MPFLGHFRGEDVLVTLQFTYVELQWKLYMPPCYHVHKSVTMLIHYSIIDVFRKRMAILVCEWSALHSALLYYKYFISYGSDQYCRVQNHLEFLASRCQKFPSH